MAVNEILSVGIDIGTSTIQTVFSRLKMQNTAGYFAVPKVSIIDKKTIFKGEIHQTPLKDYSTLDGEAVKELVAKDYNSAGFTPSDVSTGAVIITGEAARKENAQAVLSALSDFAGEFVVSTAGPDLESIIAGKGSGAYNYSKDNFSSAVNIDIGGGTTNIVLFDKGEVADKGCLDIGGRQITVYGTKISYISESAKKIADSIGVKISEGEVADVSKLNRIAEAMADIINEVISGEGGKVLDVFTKGSSCYVGELKPSAVFFSGGVADCIYDGQSDDFKFDDLGVILGRAIKKSTIFTNFDVQKGEETIRATVVGAGSYTTAVSGSTIFYDKSLLPLKNIPVLKLTDIEYAKALSGDYSALSDRVSWFMKEVDESNIVLAMKGEKNMSYDALKMLSSSIAKVVDGSYPDGAPLLLAVENDMAKVFGQTINKDLQIKRNIVSIDSVKLFDGEYIDLGKPLMDGLVIPIVVKTLIFG